MLYLVPTPIGNLEDITLRALRILKEADIILAEDTRVSVPLLKHFGIDKKVFAHHQHNEHKALQELIRFLKEGKTLAMISDAGTPGISDPGFLLVREAIQEGIPVNCLPGATAFVPALVNSGLPADRFTFEGFLPVKKGRQTRLKSLLEEERTMVFYESPHRIVKTLGDFITYYGEERPVSVSRELSKVFEETVRGTLKEVHSHFQSGITKGEFVICLHGFQKESLKNKRKEFPLLQQEPAEEEE